MARYPYQNRMMQPQQIDTGDVPYIDYNSQNINPMMMQAAEQAQQRYDLSQTLFAKHAEEVAAAKIREADYNKVIARGNKDVEDIRKLVTDKYDGQYGNAVGDIMKNLATARGTFHKAQQEYEEEQKYAPIITKLQSEGKLLFPQGDPRNKSAFDETGKYVGGVDYGAFREKSDYDATIQKAVVDGIDKKVLDSGLVSANVAGMLKSVKTQGLAALGSNVDAALEKIASEYAPVFEQETTFKIDPSKEGMSSKDYVKDTIYRLAKNVTDNQYIGDPSYEKPSKAGPSAPGMPRLIPLYSTSTLGEKLDLSNVKLTDDTFQGEVKREFLNTLWKDKDGNIDPKKFEEYLASYDTSSSGDAKKFNLSNYVVKDENGNPDVYKTLNNLDVQLGKLVGTSRGPATGPLPRAINKLKEDMEAHIKTKMDEKFGDYGVDVMGFDTDESSQDVKKRMDIYLETVSPDLFNFETGKFSDVKTKKLGDNKDFIKARADGKFKIQGIIKSPNGGVKYIAEDGSGEPQVVSSNDEMTNRNLLRLFGDPELIANYEYRDIKLSPMGNTVGYKDKKLKLPDGYSVEKEKDGRYRLINQDKVKSRNTFEKWQILESFGINPSSF